MLFFLVRRVFWSAVVVVVVAAISFAGIRILRPELNFGIPLHQGLWDYMVGVFLHFDFGESWAPNAGNVQVADELRQAYLADFSLVAGGLAAGVVMGLTGGAICAMHPRTGVARILEWLAAISLCAPVYVVALGTLLLFAPGFGVIQLPLFFEPHAYQHFHDDLWAWLRSLVVPWLILGAPLAGIVLRMTRGSMTEVLGDDYIRTAHAKGLAHSTVIRRHAVPAAAAPVASAAGVSIPLLVTNVVLIERVFSIPGVFRFTTDAVDDGDFPVLQMMAIFGAVLVVIASMAIDAVLAWLDPRVRAGGT